MANPGVLHTYTRKLVAFEHRPSPSPSPPPKNTLLWIGGLGDGLLTVTYPSAIAKALPPDWRLVEVLLTSSYAGWNRGSVGRDAEELGKCVAYFRGLDGADGGKVVLMGHSTGANDIMEYLCGEVKAEEGDGDGNEMQIDTDSKKDPKTPRPHIDGAILQGGVSDREAWVEMCERDGLMPSLLEVVQKAAEMIAQGRGQEIMPRKGNVIAETWDEDISAYRLHSLLAYGGDDDYFSSDLSDEVLGRTFGSIGGKRTAMMFLLGSEDPYVPARVDKEELVGRWTTIVRRGGGMVDDMHGGIISGARHNLNGDPEEVVQDLVKRVVGFLGVVAGGGLQDGDNPTGNQNYNRTPEKEGHTVFTPPSPSPSIPAQTHDDIDEDIDLLSPLDPPSQDSHPEITTDDEIDAFLWEVEHDMYNKSTQPSSTSTTHVFTPATTPPTTTTTTTPSNSASPSPFTKNQRRNRKRKANKKAKRVNIVDVEGEDGDGYEDDDSDGGVRL